jgi:raffinose/stachyose/melibiose transport system permease protein
MKPAAARTIILEQQPRRQGKMWNEKTFTIILFLLPTLAFMGVFVVWPIINSFQLSFLQWNGINPTRTFIGLQNWTRLLQDPIFWKSLGNNLIIVVLSIAIQIPIAMLLAIMIERSRGFLIRVFKTVYFFPMLMSSVAIGILFKYIYDPTFGLVNETLERMGFTSLTQAWLGDPKYALLAVVLVICWQFIPFYMILFHAALNNIPGELKDAALIDGANDARYYRHIALPMVMGTVRTAILLSLIGSLKYFDLIWVMTQGGPNHASELMATYMYKMAFPSFQVGYGSAVASAMFIIVMLISIATLTLSRRFDYRRAQ